MNNNLSQQRDEIISIRERINSTGPDGSPEEYITLRQHYAEALQRMVRFTEELELDRDEVVFEAGEISDREITAGNLVELANYQSDVSSQEFARQEAEREKPEDDENDANKFSRGL